MNLTQLKRLRWGVLAVVLLGILSSVAMNVLHAPPNPAARFVGGLPPLAVYACIELISRIPSSSKWLTVCRIVGAIAVAGGAGYLSYAQQFAAILDLGFPHDQSMIWPGVIDGTMIVSSVSLVEVVRKIRQVTEAGAPAIPPPVAARQWVDQFEDPATLAFREAQKKLREETVGVKALNGSSKA